LELDLDEQLRRRRNRIWIFMVLGWFLISCVLLTLFPRAGGLIATVLGIHVVIARGFLFRNTGKRPPPTTPAGGGRR